MPLTSKVFLITGAKGGLGNSTTNAFLMAGAKVAGVSIDIHDSDFPNPNFHAIPERISNADSAKELVASVITKWGRIDGLVHLIGAFAGGSPIAGTDDATFDKMMDVNFRSAFLLSRAVLPGMRAQGGGRILAIGSRAAVEPSPQAGAYAASKAALISLIRTLAAENADKQITANIILPGTMDTPANRAAMPKADPSKWVQPTQVANMLVHLASDQSSQITGAVIPIYGE